MVVKKVYDLSYFPPPPSSQSPLFFSPRTFMNWLKTLWKSGLHPFSMSTKTFQSLFDNLKCAMTEGVGPFVKHLSISHVTLDIENDVMSYYRRVFDEFNNIYVLYVISRIVFMMLLTFEIGIKRVDNKSGDLRTILMAGHRLVVSVYCIFIHPIVLSYVVERGSLERLVIRHSLSFQLALLLMIASLFSSLYSLPISHQMPEIINLSIIHHSISSILSIIINILIVKLSLSSNEKLIIKGEFKWIFMATSITNLIYSAIHLLFIPMSVRNTTDPYFFIYLSLGPLPLFVHSPVVLSYLFQFVYTRQTMANVLAICVIPLHRVAIVCYNQKKRNVLFGKIAYSVNVIPLLLHSPSYLFPRTTVTDLPILMTTPINESFISHFGVNTSQKMCHFSHNWRETGDIIQTLTDFTIITISYLITILCILRLVIYLAHNGKERSNSVGNLERQKAILFTVIVQAILPLITYTPYLVFIFTLILHGADTTGHSDLSEWYDQDYQLVILSWSPFINGVATILLLKPYRRGFFGMLPCIEIVTPSNRNQAAANLRALNNTSSTQSVTVYRTYEIATTEDDRSAVNSDTGHVPAGDSDVQ